MAQRHVFLSYDRADLTTPVAEKFYKRLKNNLDPTRFAEPFFDKRSIDPGQDWAAVIRSELDRCTHFIALLSDDYWDSEQCQIELQGAADRQAQKGFPRLLFVLTEMMRPSSLVLAADERSAQVATPFARVQNLGQISFLGPYDPVSGRLTRLKVRLDERPALSDQLYALTLEVEALD